MKTITINGRHYIWRPRIMVSNILKGLFAVSFCGFYAWALLTFFLGGWS